MKTNHLVKPKNTSAILTISNLDDQKDSYILNPPYQRGDVWDVSWKQELINSIINGLPLAPISLVERVTDDVTDYIVLDGKQRLTTVFDFIDGKFSINLELGGENHKISYSVLKSVSKDKVHKNHGKYLKIFNSFRNYNFTTVVYPEMQWPDQISLFDAINHSESLSLYEKFNKNYIYARQFADFIFSNYIPAWNHFIDNGKKTFRNRGKDLFWKFRLLNAFITDPDSLTTGVDSLPGDSTNDRCKQFMKKLDEKIKQYMISKDDKYLFDNKDRVDAMLKEFKWQKLKSNLVFFQTVLDELLQMYEYQKHYMYNIVYYTLYLTQKFEEGVFTANFFEKNRQLFLDIFQQYYQWASLKDDPNKVQRASSLPGKKLHLDKIGELINTSNLDLGVKNPIFSEDEKSKLLREAGHKCEICGSTKNLQIDHVNPGSLSSQKVGGVLCADHNKSKSDNDLVSLEEIINYIKSKSSSAA